MLPQAPCHYVRIEINREQVFAMVDSGAEISLLSEELFNRLLDGGLHVLYIPVVNGTLISAWRV